MKVLILYESCTGNTAFATELIQRFLEKEGHHCFRVRYREANPAAIEGYDLYCFASPVMSFSPLAPVLDFIGEMRHLSGKPAFIFFTCAGWPGVAPRLMARKLRHRGAVVLGDSYLPCPDSWPISRRLPGVATFWDKVFPTRRSIRKMKGFLREMVDLAYRVNDGIEVKLPSYRLWPTLTFPLGLFASRGGLRRGLGNREINLEDCNLCGRCVEVCPVNAVTLNHRPEFSAACIGCWACFNNCPRKAILSSAARPEDYYPGLREKSALFRKAGL